MNSLQILSFVGFTLLVAVITWWKVRKTDTGSQQGYFLAGRSLKAPVIAASLMLTNLSTEQLVGLSGQAYKSGMSVMGWEVTSAVTLIFLALIFLPRYLKRGIATIPDFLEERYDKTTRIIIDFCFLIATGVCFLPIVLYSGALALNSLFHVGESLQLSDGAAIWLLVILLGLAGILYAVIGGLRAMAVADSINGIGLVIGGLMVPGFCLVAMGKGSFMQGLVPLTPVPAEHVDAPGIAECPVIVELTLSHTLELGSHTQFIGEIMDVKVDSACMREDGLPDPALIDPLLFAPLVQEYWAISQFEARAFSAGHALTHSAVLG